MSKDEPRINRIQIIYPTLKHVKYPNLHTFQSGKFEYRQSFDLVFHSRIIRDDGILCVLALVRLDSEVAVEIDVIAAHGRRLVCGVRVDLDWNE